MSGIEVVVGVLSSLATTGILAFALKTFIGKYIESEFRKRADTHQATVELLKEHQKWLQEKERAIYPELNTLVYQSRNSVREFIQEDHPRFAFSVRACATALTERLYSYRAFLPPDVFEQLHTFKRCMQDAIVSIDISTRGPLSRSGNSPWNVVPPDLMEIYAQLDKLYQSITESIQEIVLVGNRSQEHRPIRATE